jgi:hypothetical protein
MSTELTELERVKMENFTLKHNALQQQLQINLAERNAFIRQIVEAHPGCAWEESRGLVTYSPEKFSHARGDVEDEIGVQ